MANTVDAPWLAEAFLNDFKQLYPNTVIPSLALANTHNNQLDIFGV
jgi:hypothetical protein